MNPPPSEQSGEVQRKEKTRWRLAAARAGMFVGDAEARKEALKPAPGRCEAERCNTSLPWWAYSHPTGWTRSGGPSRWGARPLVRQQRPPMLVYWGMETPSESKGKSRADGVLNNKVRRCESRA